MDIAMKVEKAEKEILVTSINISSIIICVDGLY